MCLCLRQAFIEPAQKFFPGVLASNYHYSRRKRGDYCMLSDMSMLTCLSGPVRRNGC